MRIPVTNLQPALAHTETAWRANLEALFAAGQFILGPQLAAFEREFAEATGAKSAIGVGSGTSAIEMALRDSGVNGEVLIPALTSPFAAAAIRSAGCTPRFVDVDPSNLQIDFNDLEERLTDATRAIVATHLYGQPCGMGLLQAFAQGREITIIQDACQAHGATIEGRPLTAWSNYVCYSFYPTKNLGALGDGGAIATDRAFTARRLKMRRDGGRGHKPQVADIAGVNSRLDEMQCCFLRAFLPNLHEWNRQRCQLAALYDASLSGCSGVQIVQRAPNSVCHLYVIRAARRDRLRGFLEKLGIGTGIHYPVPLHLHPAFSDCELKRGDLPNAERACNEIVTLPLWPYMPEQTPVEVAERIREFYRK
jgi:dTDP-4-amino-4,6-dideoxygalactose transaminase